MDRAAPAGRRDFFALISLVLILGFHVLVVGHLLSRALDHDEAEHLRAAEWMASGKTIYRDFVENHTPFLYLLLERFAPTDLDFEALRQYITNARLITAAAGTVAALCVALFSTRTSGSVVAIAPALAVLLARGWTYDRSVIDVRAEPFTLLLFWGGVLLIVRDDSNQRKQALVAGAGAALIGMAALWNPKWPLESAVIAVWYLASLYATAKRSPVDALLSLFVACSGPAIALTAALRTAPWRALLFFAYRYPLRFYEWFGSSPLIPLTFRFPGPFEYCSSWFRPAVVIPAVLLLALLLTAEWRSMSVRRRRLSILLVALIISGALELRFLYSYPRLWPQYFVMWGCSLAAAYGVVLSAAPRRFRTWSLAANAAVFVLFCAHAWFEIREPVAQSHWTFKEAIVNSLRPGEGVWIDPADGPFVAPAGAYYWYAYKDQVPFSLVYAHSLEARNWLPPMTERDLPPCRMLDAHLHGLPKDAIFVRFLDRRNVVNLPESARCLSSLEQSNFAHAIGNSPLVEVRRPPRRY